MGRIERRAGLEVRTAALGVALATAVVLAATAGTAAAAPSAPRADAALDRALTRLVAMPGGPPGTIAVVQRGARRKVFNHGVADLRTRRRIDVNDHWRIASVSKAFNGAVALSLVNAGRLSLDDTIAQRLPNLPAAWGRVTLAQALQHTSGMPDFSATAGWQRAGITRRPLDPMTLIGFVANDPLAFTPGSRYVYSNTDNVVAALIAEAATGLSYERLLSQLVTDPLAMRRTMMPMGYRMPAPYVHGYANNTTGLREDGSEVVNPTVIWAAGGITSSPFDLTQFVRAYGGGRLFSGATRAAQLRFRPGNSDPQGPGTNAAGLAIFRYRTRCGTVYGHTGNFPGYTAFIATSPNGRRSITFQSSTQMSAGAGVPAVFRAWRRTAELGVCAALAAGSGTLAG